MRNEKIVGELFGCDLPDARIRHSPTEPWQRPSESKFDYFQCGHCGTNKYVRPYQRPEDIGGLCRHCMKAICPACVDTGRCDPLEEKIKRAEERQYIRNSYGI